MAYHDHHHHHDHHHYGDFDGDGAQQVAPAVVTDSATSDTNLAPNDVLLGTNPSDVLAALPTHTQDTSSSDLTQPQADLPPTQTADATAHDATQVQPDPTQIADATTHDVTPTQIPTQTIDPTANDVTATASTQTPTIDTTAHDVTLTAPSQTPTVDTTTHDTTLTAPTQTPTIDTTAQDATQNLSPQTGTQATNLTAQAPTQTQTQAQPVSLTHTTTAIHTDHDGQVIQGLDIYVDHGDAVTITNNDVVLRDCRIHYADGNGVSISDASHVTIENCEIIDTAPPSGISQGTNENDDILAQNASNLTVQDTTVRDGSTGLYLLDSPGATISHVDGYDFHGPFPRGQFVQFDKSGGSSLTDFYAFNDPAHSSPEDIVSVYASPNTTVSNGVIDGNNSASGVGVMFENGSTGGRVTNVDAIHQANGAFSSYDSNVIFDHTRSFDNIATDQGRGLPDSNALIWNVSSPGVSIESSTYTNPADPNNIVWDASKAVVADVHQDPSATPTAHITNQFDWMV